MNSNKQRVLEEAGFSSAKTPEEMFIKQELESLKTSKLYEVLLTLDGKGIEYKKLALDELIKRKNIECLAEFKSY